MAHGEQGFAYPIDRELERLAQDPILTLEEHGIPVFPLEYQPSFPPDRYQPQRVTATLKTAGGEIFSQVRDTAKDLLGILNLEKPCMTESQKLFLMEQIWALALKKEEAKSSLLLDPADPELGEDAQPEVSAEVLFPAIAALMNSFRVQCRDCTTLQCDRRKEPTASRALIPASSLIRTESGPNNGLSNSRLLLTELEILMEPGFRRIPLEAVKWIEIKQRLPDKRFLIDLLKTEGGKINLSEQVLSILTGEEIEFILAFFREHGINLGENFSADHNKLFAACQRVAASYSDVNS